jgi:hypothetical protein
MPSATAEMRLEPRRGDVRAIAHRHRLLRVEIKASAAAQTRVRLNIRPQPA